MYSIVISIIRDMSHLHLVHLAGAFDQRDLQLGNFVTRKNLRIVAAISAII